MEEALEADLKQRVDRLRGACDQRSSNLRQEHEMQLGKLDRAEGGGSNGGRSASVTTPGSSAPVQSVELLTAPASTPSSRLEHHVKGKKQSDDTKEKKSTELQQPRGQNEESKLNQNQAQEQAQRQEREQERGNEGRGTSFSRQSPPPFVAVAVAAAVTPLPVPIPVPILAPILVPGAGAGVGVVAGVTHHARKKEMVDLQDELGRHLAVAHADGGRHLREATRVMRLIEEVGAQIRLEAEVCVERFPIGTLSVVAL